MKQGELGTEEAIALYASMCKLNAAASRAALAVGARCATDVTGFGLLGHASHIAAASGVTLAFDPRRIPACPGVEAAWESRNSNRRRRAQLESTSSRASTGDRATDSQRAILIDPQTSGGLLVAVPPDRVAEYLSLVPEGGRDR